MKHILLICGLACCFACSKSVDTASKPATTAQARTVTDNQPSGTLTVQLDDAVLTVQMKPNLVCYASENGEADRPCDIFVDMNCTLSQPIQKSVLVKVERVNIVRDAYSDVPNPVQPTAESSQTFAFTIAPGTTSVRFESPFRNENNISVPDGRFRILSATTFNMVN